MSSITANSNIGSRICLTNGKSVQETYLKTVITVFLQFRLVMLTLHTDVTISFEGKF